MSNVRKITLTTSTLDENDQVKTLAEYSTGFIETAQDIPSCPDMDTCRTIERFLNSKGPNFWEKNRLKFLDVWESNIGRKYRILKFNIKRYIRQHYIKQQLCNHKISEYIIEDGGKEYKMCFKCYKRWQQQKK